MNSNRCDILLRPILFIFVFSISILSPTWASDKKGIGLADLNAAETINALNVAWYYTWSPNPIKGVALEKFVPMLRSRGGRLLDEQVSSFHKQKKVPTLLVLNEPNTKEGDNMSAEDVIRSWPEISSLADNIGTPATAGVFSPWFDKFYKMAKDRNYKMDFMTIHPYSPPDAKLFLNKLDQVYEKYHLPIWITEFAVADFTASKKRCKTVCESKYTEQQVLAFMKEVLPELEKRPYVIRYAWFGAGKASLAHEQVRTSALFDKDKKLTELGKFYANFQ
ncbi:MAG: glycosyl hydrolase [Methylobacter sp.]|nr:glycosyl hydrolase [Methylobacter sp.]